jgi:hypothetical protein
MASKWDDEEFEPHSRVEVLTLFSA